MKKRLLFVAILIAVSTAAEFVLMIGLQQSSHFLLWSILSYIVFLTIISLTAVLNLLITKHFYCRVTNGPISDSFSAPSLPYRQEAYAPIIRETYSTPSFNYGNNCSISINDIAYKPKIEPLGTSDINFVNSIISHTLDNLSHKYSISSLCIDLGNERTYLYRQIKGIYNCTPIDFINAIKMAYAAKLLQDTDIPIRDIMFKVGMSDNVVSFENTFRKLYKCSPVNYRNKNRLAENQ